LAKGRSAAGSPLLWRKTDEAEMGLRTDFLRARRAIAIAFVAGGLTAMGTLTVPALPNYTISQKGREFHPGTITIKRGDTIQIVNDDADLLHHAYIDSPKFSFDSGDQKPGSVTPIIFTVAGDFNVLCAIHPKMLLVVHVK
jgi:plastocyanin